MWAVSLVLRNLLYFFHYFSLLCSLCSFHIVSPRASIPKSVLKFFFCFTSLFFVYSERFPWLFHNSLLNYLSQLKFKFSPATLCDPMDCSLSVHHQLPEFTKTHVHWVHDAIQPSHPLSSPSPPTFNLSQQKGLFTWVSSSHQVAKVLEFHLQHQSFQWTPRTDLL